MNRLLELLRRAFLLVAWVLALCAALLVTLEESGMLTSFVRDRLADELGDVGEHVHVERARLLWFEPGIVLEGVTFDGERGPDGRWRKGRERLRLSSVHARLYPRLDQKQPVAEVEVRGGRVVLADALLDAVRSLGGGRAGEPAERSTPPISVRGIAVQIEIAGGDDLPIGSAEALIQDPPSGPTSIFGRLMPTLGGGVISTAPIYLEGETDDEGALVLHASARSIALDSAEMDAAGPARLAGAPALRGELTARLDARLPAGDAAPEAAVRLQLRRAHVELESRVQAVADDLDLDVDATFAPERSTKLWDPYAWAATVHASGRWNRSPFEAWAVSSPVSGAASADTWLEAWASVEDLHLDEQTLVAIGADTRRSFREGFAALSPAGVVDTHVALRLARAAEGERPWLGKKELLADFRADGNAEMTFQGWLDRSGVRQGFPVRCSGVRGLVMFARTDSGRTSAGPWLNQAALVGLTGEHGTGSVRAQGMISARAYGITPDVDLRLEVPSMAVGPALAAGLNGLRSTRWIWDTFRPAGGTVSSEMRLRARPAMGGVSGEGSVRLHDVGLVWRDVPVPLERVSGEVLLRFEDQTSILTDVAVPVGHRPAYYRPVAVRWDLANQPGSGQVVRARGLARGESLAPRVATADIPKEPTQALVIELDGLLLRGQDWDTLTARFPDLGAGVEELRGQGAVDATFHGRRPSPTAPYRYDVEVRPANVVLTPRVFGRQTQDVQGRVLVHGREAPGSQKGGVNMRFALFGAWGADVALATHGTFASGAGAEVVVHGAGVDPASPTLKGILMKSIADEPGRGESADLSAIEVDGRLDFEARVELAAAKEIAPKTSYRVFLRGNRFRSEAIRLGDMHGVLEQHERVLHSPLLSASLAGTPIELRNVLFLSLDAARTHAGADPLLVTPGFLSGEEGYALQADWSAAGVALDHEHLSPFVDPETLKLFLESAELAGAIDVEAAHLLVVSEGDGKDKVAFRGHVTPRNVRLRAGLPLDVENASIAVERLILEAGRVRGWWRVGGLMGEVAGRRVEDAEMIMTYVDGRLTVDNLRGSLGGGRVTSLGAVEQADRAIAIDLSEPYSYAVAMRLSDVGVEDALGDLFESSVEELGHMSASLRLRGRGKDVLALSGGGVIRLFDARLWSIPAVRELFRALGFDETAIFDQMDVRWSLEDGTIKLSDLRVRSPLLQLVGEGTVELTGEIRSDLQVRYSLVDKLGPLNRVVYWLNNSLWQVAIRGDLSRPDVRVRNSIAEFLFGFENDPPRALPLPGWSPLSSRF